jgi:hypothetical protein
VFRRRSAGAPDGTAQDSPGAESPDSPANNRVRPAAEAGKGRPTPKRSDAERGRYQPIGGSRTRARSAGPRTATDKAGDRADKARKYEAMKRGEDWALAAKDKGPVRALARDYVDSKRRVSEYYMYLLIVLVAALFIRSKSSQSLLAPLVLALILVMAVDGYFVRRGLHRLLAQRLPGEPTRGVTAYAVMRAIQIRKLRMPQPRVRPGDKI